MAAYRYYTPPFRMLSPCLFLKRRKSAEIALFRFLLTNYSNWKWVSEVCGFTLSLYRYRNKTKMFLLQVQWWYNTKVSLFCNHYLSIHLYCNSRSLLKVSFIRFAICSYLTQKRPHLTLTTPFIIVLLTKKRRHFRIIAIQYANLLISIPSAGKRVHIKQGRRRRVLQYVVYK